jgi:RimJ/RimL family protein N-acetyltransferase
MNNEHKNALGQITGFPVSDWMPARLPTRKIMTGRFCRLEPLDLEVHTEDLFAAHALDPEGRNWTYLPYGPFSTYEAYSDWIDRFSTGSDPLFFAVISAETGRAVGVASYLRIDPANGSIEVGHLNFSPLMQRTPIATEAMWLMMKEAFDLGYRRYEWKCNALNIPSRAAAQRLGLSFEGVFRQAAVIKGHNRDTAWYATIDKEWPALNEAFQKWLAPENFDEEGRQRVALSRLTEHVLVKRG